MITAPDPSDLLHERELAATQRLRDMKASGKIPVLQMEFQTSRTNVTPEFGVEVEEPAPPAQPEPTVEKKAKCEKHVAFSNLPPEARGSVNPCAIIIIILVSMLIIGVYLQSMNRKKYL